MKMRDVLQGIAGLEWQEAAEFYADPPNKARVTYKDSELSIGTGGYHGMKNPMIELELYFMDTLGESVSFHMDSHQEVYKKLIELKIIENQTYGSFMIIIRSTNCVIEEDADYKKIQFFTTKSHFENMTRLNLQEQDDSAILLPRGEMNEIFNNVNNS